MTNTNASHSRLLLDGTEVTKKGAKKMKLSVAIEPVSRVVK